MTEVRVAVGEPELLERLADLPRSSVVHWKPDEGPAPGRVDLLVLPYMVGPSYLTCLAGAPVRVVQSQMLGHEDVERFLPGGMTYCNAVDVHEASTAELAAALILSCQRGLPGFRDAQHEGRWDHRTTPGLAGSRVTIVGAGGVGTKIADVLAPFDVSLSQVARRARRNRHGTVLPLAELDTVLQTSDVVVLAVPLTEATRGLVGAEFLSRMPDGALLVNVSRGPVVDTDSLLAELTSGRLRAALDVTEPEPLPADHPLWRAPGVVITPHVGGDTSARIPRIERIVREQVRRIHDGEPLVNVVAGARRHG